MKAVIIARTKKKNYATFTVEGKTILSVETIKYLGVTIDARLTFNQHLLNKPEGIKVGPNTGPALCPTSEVSSDFGGVLRHFVWGASLG